MAAWFDVSKTISVKSSQIVSKGRLTVVGSKRNGFYHICARIVDVDIRQLLNSLEQRHGDFSYDASLEVGEEKQLAYHQDSRELVSSNNSPRSRVTLLHRYW